MHEQRAVAALEAMPLQFRRVVRNIVDGADSQPLRAASKDLGKHLSNAMEDDLAVRERHVGRTAHRGQVVSTRLRGEGRTGQLPVDDRKSELGGH